MPTGRPWHRRGAARQAFSCCAWIDTHADKHHVTVNRAIGATVDDKGFPNIPAGLADLLGWLKPRNPVVVGIEGSSSYGAELTRRLTASGLTVREVTWPAGSQRGVAGKTDKFDAVLAARCVAACGGYTPKRNHHTC